MCGAFESLSPREKEVLALVAEGKTDRAILVALDPPVSEETVAEHLRRIFRKAGVENRTELSALWIEHQDNHGGRFAGW